MILHALSRRARSGLRVAALLAVVTAPAAAVAAQQRTAATDPGINPGDVIRLEVWREEEMTGEFLVDQHGRVTLPLVGEIETRDHTELSLRAFVRERMNESIWNPSIQLVVLKGVRVLGEVLEPGLFHLDPTKSVADALAMAGGRTPLAVDGRVVLRRPGEQIDADVETSMRLSDLSVRTGDELLVPRASFFSRNAAAIVAGVTGVLTAAVIYATNK